MRALSVRQPWAWAIASAGKDVENRTRPTKHRGELAIHASLSYDEMAAIPVPSALGLFMDAVRAEVVGAHVPALARGAVIAVVEITGCHLSPDFGGTCGATRPLCSPWAQRDQFHWLLANVRPLARPVSAKGALGLWTVPADVESAVMAQLEER
jgi:hypothetical protein